MLKKSDAWDAVVLAAERAREPMVSAETRLNRLLANIDGLRLMVEMLDGEGEEDVQE